MGENFLMFILVIVPDTGTFSCVMHVRAEIENVNITTVQTLASY